MQEQIGVIAGKIWDLVNSQGETSVAQLKKTVESNAFLLNCAIGWLAREDKVLLSKKGNSVRVSLK